MVLPEQLDILDYIAVFYIGITESIMELLQCNTQVRNINISTVLQLYLFQHLQRKLLYETLTDVYGYGNCT